MGGKRQVCVLLGLMLFVTAVWAQTEATVSGTVTDPSGAQVLAASVTALNLDTGVTTSTVTNAAGVYVFASLAPEDDGERRSGLKRRLALAHTAAYHSLDALLQLEGD